jgi:hypothetical protein
MSSEPEQRVPTGIETFFFVAAFLICAFTGTYYSSSSENLMLCLFLTSTAGFIAGGVYGRKSLVEFVLTSVSCGVGGAAFMILVAGYINLRGGSIHRLELLIPSVAASVIIGITYGLLGSLFNALGVTKKK